MGVCSTFDCTAGLPNVVIPNCGNVDFGQAFVKVFIALPEASSFNGESDLANSATWATRLAYTASGATKAQRIVVIGDLYSGFKPQAELETEQAPYGGDELINRKHKITFEIKKWNKQLIDSLNQLRCFGRVRVWALSNTGYIFGGETGFEDANLNLGGLEFAGIGNGQTKSTNEISWNAIDDSEPVLAAFLKTMTN
jgi:hypothetical protein